MWPAVLLAMLSGIGPSLTGWREWGGDGGGSGSGGKGGTVGGGV